MSAGRGCAPKQWPFDGAAVENMQRVKDPDERKRLQDKSRRIFLRIAAAATLLFVAGVVLTVILLPQLSQTEDDGKGPCPVTAAAAATATAVTAVAGNGTSDGGGDVSAAAALGGLLLCNGHGTCDDDFEHSHCECSWSMHDGPDCESVSLGFICGAPTAVLAVLWLVNLGWILRGGGQKPLPTEDELAALYSELCTVFVRPPPPPPPPPPLPSLPSAEEVDMERGGAKPLPHAQQQHSGGGRSSMLLSEQWTSGLGAVIVLVRRPG